MDKEIKKIVDAISINVNLAKINGEPIVAEVVPSEKSKEYLASMIEVYGIGKALEAKAKVSEMLEMLIKAKNTLKDIYGCDVTEIEQLIKEATTLK